MEQNVKSDLTFVVETIRVYVKYFIEPVQTNSD